MGAVICYWDDFLDVVGPTKDTIRYLLILQDTFNL